MTRREKLYTKKYPMLTTKTEWQCYHKIDAIDYANRIHISYVPHLCTIEHKADNM